MSSFLTKLIIIVDTLQMMGFSIHPSLPFIWNNTLMTYVRGSIKYFQLDSVLRGSSYNFTNFVIFLIFGITLLMNAIMIYICVLIKYYNTKLEY